MKAVRLLSVVVWIFVIAVSIDRVYPSANVRKLLEWLLTSGSDPYNGEFEVFDEHLCSPPLPRLTDRMVRKLVELGVLVYVTDPHDTGVSATLSNADD